MRGYYSYIISIHAPHTRSDHILKDLSLYNLISIHAPHTRSDEKGDIIRYVSPDFNPRSSYEERQGAGRILCDCIAYFNPRSSYEERH